MAPSQGRVSPANRAAAMRRCERSIEPPISERAIHAVCTCPGRRCIRFLFERPFPSEADLPIEEVFSILALPSRAKDRLDIIGTRREDAQKRDENTRVPERRDVVPTAPGEAGEDTVLPVFDIANLGVTHWKTVEEELHQ